MPVKARTRQNGRGADQNLPAAISRPSRARPRPEESIGSIASRGHVFVLLAGLVGVVRRGSRRSRAHGRWRSSGGENPGLVRALRRAALRLRVNDNRSGSRSPCKAASCISRRIA